MGPDPGHQGVEMFPVCDTGWEDKSLPGRRPGRQPKGPDNHGVEPSVMVVAFITAEDRVPTVFPEIIQEPPGPGGRQIMAVPEIHEQASQGDGRGLPRIVGPVGEAELRELGRDLPAVAVGAPWASIQASQLSNMASAAASLLRKKNPPGAVRPSTGPGRCRLPDTPTVHLALDDPPVVLEFGAA